MNGSKHFRTWLGWGMSLALAFFAFGHLATGSAADLPQVIRKTAQESRPIAITSDGARIVTANIDVPTITVVDSKARTVIAEIPVGKEPRNLALSPDDRFAYVTNMYDDRVSVVDLQLHKQVAVIAVPHQPFGIVTSPDGSRLYVSAYRGSAVHVIDTRTRKLITSIQVEPEPRGLAISANGEDLYVSHYVYGKISVIDTRTTRVKKVIALAETPEPANHNEKVSQGLPGMAENMTFSADGSQIWIPHLLTNVDTPIQFESIVFPVISLLDTKQQTELIQGRKHLFKQMNIVNVKNETEILSNPADTAFLPDGSKAFVIMGGSEDLVTFNLQRGGNATHLLRRIPGDNPRGLVISPDGSMLYVHNAMSHDLVWIATGGSSPYQKAAISGKPVRLISKDPLSPDVRKGKTLFFSANSDEYAAPITGKNWMSCASCHFDGEINGLTLLTPKGPRNVPSNVLAAKTGLFMWDGSRDDFTDYLHTVQDEMGGMTAYDPGKPLPPEVEQMYDQIFAYLQEESSLPVPKSPFRQPDGQLTPLARQGEALFNGKAGCITCHATDTFTDSALAVDANGKLTTANTAYLHDVGTDTAADVGSPKGDARAGFMNPRTSKQYDTPTLRGVWATAPYLHDGSAKTIRDVLVTRNQQGKHGTIEGLSEQEIDALVEYVLSID